MRGVMFCLFSGWFGVYADNDIEASGAEKVAEALKVNKTVTSLNLNSTSWTASRYLCTPSSIALFVGFTLCVWVLFLWGWHSCFSFFVCGPRFFPRAPVDCYFFVCCFGRG